jgi:hypothetical protein
MLIYVHYIGSKPTWFSSRIPMGHHAHPIGYVPHFGDHGSNSGVDQSSQLAARGTHPALEYL